MFTNRCSWRGTGFFHTCHSFSFPFYLFLSENTCKKFSNARDSILLRNYRPDHDGWCCRVSLSLFCIIDLLSKNIRILDSRMCLFTAPCRVLNCQLFTIFLVYYTMTNTSIINELEFTNKPSVLLYLAYFYRNVRVRDHIIPVCNYLYRSAVFTAWLVYSLTDSIVVRYPCVVIS